MDAFFASVEQRDNPQFRGKPIAVGGSKERGVVAAASYEARKYGVRSAMPSITAAKLCPDLIFVPPRFEVYKAVSRQLNNIFREYTDKVEPLSMDEAFLDVTENKKNLPSATLIAGEIRKEIFKNTQLTASAGISINKFLAKIASDINKPNGQKLIKPEDALQFIDNLEVKRFPYVGKVTASKMNKLGIFFGKDLKNFDKIELNRLFGKQGLYYHQVVRCEQDSPVISNRIRKSVGAENTFDNDLTTKGEVFKELDKISSDLHKRIERISARGKTITLKIKDHNFNVNTRSRSIDHFTNDPDEIIKIVHSLAQSHPLPEQIRLLGISISNLYSVDINSKSTQLTLGF